MPIIIGFLLIILLIGFIASGKFGSLAQSKGYSSAKAKKYPWFIAGAALFCNFLGQTLLSFVEGQMILIRGDELQQKTNILIKPPNR